ncbi:MAG: hypothetical protein U1D06_15380, partial [Paracoccaceae bacterium]|nr:hypothetical protein [Paracoccaceae bacterium]
ENSFPSTWINVGHDHISPQLGEVFRVRPTMPAGTVVVVAQGTQLEAVRVSRRFIWPRMPGIARVD